ncbi:MAG: hypothetical protein M3O90_06250 [Actinomycetota bacterium]|nr:hypothetical protein [Actinomycetota bacterium]
MRLGFAAKGLQVEGAGNLERVEEPARIGDGERGFSLSRGWMSTCSTA